MARARARDARDRRAGGRCEPRSRLGTDEPAWRRSTRRTWRFLVYSLLGADCASAYGQAGEQIHHLAVDGIRLVIGELRQDPT
jgi:hypothetical protein